VWEHLSYEILSLTITSLPPPHREAPCCTLLSPRAFRVLLALCVLLSLLL